MYVMGIGWESIDWIGAAQDKGNWSSVGSSMKFKISQYVGIFDQLGKCHPWS
jgi:hypothetical protein